MSKAKALSSRQLAVIEDLFAGEHKEQEILDRHKLSRKLYNKWLADDAFNARLDWRIRWEYRRSEFKLARSVPEAVSNLVELAKSGQTETARRACLDIIKMLADRLADNSAPGDDNPAPDSKSQNFSPETAGKILTILAQQQEIKPCSRRESSC